MSEHEQSARTQHVQTAAAQAMAQTVAQARQHADVSFQDELKGIKTVEVLSSFRGRRSAVCS